MFRDCKYTSWYFSIIYRAKAEGRKKSKAYYYENHHIIPKSLGGNNDDENLVLLTAREHFIVHWLLVKMVEGRDNTFKMACAFQRMSQCSNRHKRRITARQHEIVKIVHSRARKGRSLSDEHRRKLSEAKIGIPHDEARKSKMSVSQRGKRRSDMTKQRLSISKAKTYRLVNPSGEIQEITNMKAFCLDNGLHVVNMYQLISGKYKSYRGWTNISSE